MSISPNTLTEAPPAWQSALRAAYRAGHNFFIAAGGGALDYQAPLPGYGLRRHAAESFGTGAKRSMVIFYDLDQGLLLSPEDEKRLREILGSPAARKLLPPGAEAAPVPASLRLPPAAAFALLERLLQVAGQRPPQGTTKTDAELAAEYPYPSERVIVFIEKAHLIVPDVPPAQMAEGGRVLLAKLQNWSLEGTITQSPHIVVLITPEAQGIHASLRNNEARWMVLDAPLPDLETRTRFAQTLLTRPSVVKAHPDLSLTAPDLGSLTSGLSLRQLEDLFWRLEKSKRLTRSAVSAEAMDTMRQAFEGGVEPLEPGVPFALGARGMERQVEWATENIIEPLQSGDREGLAKGAILAGSTGLGKTHFVRMLVGATGLRGFQVKLEAVQSALVGSTEGRFTRILKMITSQAPCIAFFDELDQSDGAGRGNASGNPVAKNVFAILLKWLSDPATLEAGIVVLVATNRPDLLDPALKRRLGDTLPFIPYDWNGRAGVLTAQAQMQRGTISEEATTWLVDRTTLWSAADLEAIVTRALRRARREGRAEITLSDAEWAKARFRPVSLQPITPGGPPAVTYYTRLAIDGATDISVLPPPSEWVWENPPTDVTDPLGAAAAGIGIGRATTEGGTSTRDEREL